MRQALKAIHFTKHLQTLLVVGLLCLVFSSQAQPTSGLIAYYPFNGNANDLSGNGNNGTVSGATITTDRFGTANSAYTFDGINDVITVINATVLNPQYITISAWLFSTGTGVTNNGHAVSKGVQTELFVETTVGGFLGSHVNNDPFKSTTVVPTNVWKHVTLVRDLTTTSLYMDGALVQSFASTGPITATASNLTFGSRSGEAGTWYQGKIDDIRIYNRAISASEIQALFNETSPLAYYPFNGNANDESGRLHTGTVNGALLTTDRFGFSNSAYDFTNDYITVPDQTDLDIQTDFTTSFWIYPRSSTGTGGVILNKYLSTVADSWYVQMNLDPRISLSATGATLVQGPTLTLNEWSAWAITFTNSTNAWKIYKNGIQVASGTSAVVIANTTNNLYIGAQQTGISTPSSYFDGKIDDIRIHKRALSASEVLASAELDPVAQPTAISFSGVTESAMTVGFTAASGLPTGYIGLRKTTSSPTDVPVDGVTYTSGSTIGTSTVAFVGTGTSFPVTGLTSSTVYYYDIFSYNIYSGLYYYLGSSPLEGSQTTLATQPTAQPTAMTFSSVTTSAMTVNFTAATGTPSGYLALRRSGSSPTDTPVDGTAYTAGTTIGTSTVAFSGSTTSFSQSSLTASTVYHYDIFSYNGTTGTYNYLTSSPLEGSQSTLATQPTAQPTTISFSSVSNTGMTVSFTAATGPPAGYVAFRRAGSSPTEVPVDGTAYTAGASIGSSTVAYSGSSASFSLSGLTAATVYFFDIFSFNGTTGTYNYLTSGPLEGSQATFAAQPTAQPTSITFSSVSATDITVSFTAAAGSPSGYIALRKAFFSAGDVPVDGLSYTAGATIGNSSVAYVGSSTSFIDGSLTSETNYFYDIFSYNGTTGTNNYLTSSPLQGSQITFANQPTAQPTAISFSSVSTTNMNVSFTAASGSLSGYLVLRKIGSSPTEVPVDGSSYTTGTVLGSSTVAYAGGNSTGIFLPGLTAETNYYFDIYSYSGTTGTYNYLESSPLEGNQSTLASEPSFQPGNMSFSSVSETSMTVTFSAAPGAPSGYIALARASFPASDLPTDGVGYTQGNSINGGIVVSVGTGNSFTATGLSPSTYYYFYIYAYNGTDGTYNYLTSGPLQGSQITLPIEPTAQPTAMTFSSINESNIQVNYTPAAGFPSGYIALQRAGSSPTEVPVDGTVYTADDIIGSSSVAFVGSGSGFGAGNLAASTVYYYDIYSYNSTNGTYNYLQGSPLEGSQTTFAAQPSGQPSNITFSSVAETSMTVNFFAAPGPPTGYLAVMRAGNSSFDAPANGTGYVPGPFITSGNKVVFVGPGTSFTVTGLSASTIYFFDIFAYYGTTGTYNYLTASSPLEGNQSTLAGQPTAPPSGINFSAISSTSMNVNFTSATGFPSGYIAIRNTGSAPTEIPTDGTLYNSGTGIGNSNSIVAFAGSSTNFSVSNLTAGTVYYYAIYSYNYSFNGTFLTYNYLETPALTGSQATMFPEPTSQPTGITFGNISETGMTVSFTLASGSPTGYIGEVRAGSSPVSPPYDGFPYSAGGQNGESKIAFVGQGNSFQVTGLSPSTIYYYDVYSYNGLPGAYNYLATAPLEGSYTTLTTEPTAQPSTITFTGVLRTSLTVNWVASGSPSGYLVVRSAVSQVDPPTDGKTYVAPIVNGNGTVVYVGTALTYTDNGLQPETKYYYTVYAYNGAAASINYKTSAPLQESLTTPKDTTIPVPGTGPTSSPSISAGQQATITAQLSDDESGIAQAYVLYRYIAQGGPLLQAKLDASGSNMIATLPAGTAPELGIEYKIVGVNGIGLIYQSEMKQIKIEHTGFEIKYASYGEQPSAYRMFSVPADLATKSFTSIFDELGAYDQKKWRIYRYDKGSTVEVSTKEIESGKGYWLIARDDPGRTIQTGRGTTVGATTDVPSKLALSAGWNQIGNPYNFNLKWSDVLTRNPDLNSAKLKVYDGVEYKKLEVFNKMEGAFVYSPKATDLVFPVVKDISVNSRLQESKESQERDPDGWMVPLMLTQADMVSSLPGIGMHIDASEDFDKYDDLSMPRFFSYLELNHTKKIHGNPYNLDVVPSSDSHTWKFKVESSTNDEDITMSWPVAGDIVGNGSQLFLLDETENVAVDMRLAQMYTFPSARSFRIIYGPDKYLAAELPEGKGKILSVYPNPARQELTAVVAIPSWNKEYDVSIDLVNTLGQRTAVMYSGTLRSGTHVVEWNGFENRPPAGIYFVRLVCNGHVSIQRLVLL